MSGETEQEKSGWTTDTLKYYVDQRFDAVQREVSLAFDAAQNAQSELALRLDERWQLHLEHAKDTQDLIRTDIKDRFAQADKALTSALAAQKEAVAKAEAAAEKRFDSVNEFRAQLSDQAQTFMTRTEANAIQERNQERLQDLTDRMNRDEGSNAGQALSKNGMFTVVGVAVAFLGLVIVFANYAAGRG